MYNPDEECRKIMDSVREICVSQGISQNALAKAAGISNSTMSSLMTGKTSPYVHTLLKICNALGVRLEDVVETGETSGHESNREETGIQKFYRRLPEYKKEQLCIYMDMLEQYDRDKGTRKVDGLF